MSQQTAHTYILASASPRRKELIKLIGIDPAVVASAVTEDAQTEDPAELVRTLSARKARDVAAHYQNGEYVIGADTCVFTDGKILGKPASHEEARDMVARLSGSTHTVYTGVTVVRCAGDCPSETFVEETDVTVFPMTDAEIDAYAAGEEPMDKAGAYGIQGVFCRYIASLSGDYFNVVGLPLGRLYQTLKHMTGGSL